MPADPLRIFAGVSAAQGVYLLHPFLGTAAVWLALAGPTWRTGYRFGWRLAGRSGR